MRHSFFLILMIIFSNAVSAQWRPNPFYFNFKGVKADSVLIVPRDTTQLNVGGEPDSARIAYKNKSLWVKTPTSWKRVDNKVSYLFDSVNLRITIGPDLYYLYDSPLFVNKRILSIQIENAYLMPVATVDEIYGPGPYQGFTNYYYDPSIGRLIMWHIFDPSQPYNPRMIVLYTDL